MAKIDQVNIVSSDLDATLKFYRLLGVPMRDPIRSPSGHAFHINSVDEGGALLEADSDPFARMWNQGWKDAPDLAGRVVIGLRTSGRAEVDRLHDEAVAAGNPSLQPPFDAFWGARYAIIEDPDGIAVGIMSEADEAHRVPPMIPD